MLLGCIHSQKQILKWGFVRKSCFQVATSIAIRSWNKVSRSINSIPWSRVMFIIKSKSWTQVALSSAEGLGMRLHQSSIAGPGFRIALLTNCKPFSSMWKLTVTNLGFKSGTCISKIASREQRTRLSWEAGPSLSLRLTLISSHDLSLLSTMPSKGGGHHCQRD